MKTLVVYDSAYGNTRKIAESIGSAVSGEVKVLPAGEVGPADLKSLDFLIAGSPTYGGRPTPAMIGFLDTIPQGALKGIGVAAFDTRLPSKWVKIFGFAAGKIAGSLKSKGGTPAAPPEPFFVKGTQGPLLEGEPERAAAWAKELVTKK
jgi:flavodoxin I